MIGGCGKDDASSSAAPLQLSKPEVVEN